MKLKVDLSGKTAAITGSTSGIGLGIAEELARNGANIVLNSSQIHKKTTPSQKLTA